MEFKQNGEVVGRMVGDQLEIIDAEKLCYALIEEIKKFNLQATAKVQAQQENIDTLKKALKLNI